MPKMLVFAIALFSLAGTNEAAEQAQKKQDPKQQAQKLAPKKPVHKPNKKIEGERIVVSSDRLAYFIQQVMQRTVTQEEINRLLGHPDLKVYRPYDMTIPESVERGAVFVEKHLDGLRKAEEKYGIAPDETTALFRKETYLGRNTGSHPTLRLLMTKMAEQGDEGDWKLAARRAAALLGYCHPWGSETQDFIDYCISQNGSDEGAIGIGQFMPENLESFWVDTNGDQKIDPFDWDEAAMSTGNLLHANGWPMPDVKDPAKRLQKKRDALAKYYSGRPYAMRWDFREYADSILRYAAAVKKLAEERKLHPPTPPSPTPAPAPDVTPSPEPSPSPEPQPNPIKE